ncbi:fimbria/pilus outer membrane usher protein [Cupriavidus sp. CuC1]|uniref:fimbria/pilus outer membrane usher protein n=1 Tax=Cupriavidus sp. CuC1 TaxID=3373131 RepID=UPI0037D8A6E0
MQSSVHPVRPAGPARAAGAAAPPASRLERFAPRLIGAVAAIAMSPTAWAAATLVGQGAGGRQPMDIGAQISERLAREVQVAQDDGPEPARSPGGDANGLSPEPVILSALDGKRVVFDSYMLAQGADGITIDTSRFERPDLVEPGKYRVELHVNGHWRGTEDIEFQQVAGRESAQACYDRDLLIRAGVDLNKSARGQDPGRPPNPMPQGLVCADIGQYIPGAELKFDQAEQKIYLSVPQYYLRLTTSKNYVDPQNWDSGVPAMLLNYNTNIFTTESQGRNTTRAYAGLNLGANLGPLRLRHNGSVTWSPQAGGRYQRGYIYGQTDLPALRSQLLVGESSTSGELFDSVAFRGAQIFSDDRMLPGTQRYYAPVVRGSANSNARVSVHQRGFLVYETTVAPGPFEINDLQVASYGGDLQVTVTEANGQARTFVVPFATTVQLLRPGVTRYSVTAGRASDLSLQGSGQYIVQGTMVTGYGGVAFASNYVSGLLGAALNTPIGGFGTDVTWARTTVTNGASMRGSSFRVSYSKNLPNSGTNFSLLAYRYSTSGYLGLRDALMLHDAVERGASTDSFSRMRSRVDANISQQLGTSGGSVYLNGSSLQYWKQRGQVLSFTLGYSNQWRGNTYSVSVQRVQNAASGGSLYGGRSRGNSTLVSLNLSIPLGKSARGAPVLNTFATHDDRVGTQVSSGVSGLIDERGRGSYSLSGNYDDRRSATSGSASINYRLPDVTLGASIGQGQGYRQASASAQGGVVMHPGGISLAQTLGETIGVVHAPDALGAQAGYSGASVDRRGYAIVPSLTPYQLNSIDVDPKGMPDDVELKVTSRSVAPRAGTVVMLTYETRRARPVLINSRMPNGELLPFAAAAIDADSGMAIGAVGQGSRLVVRSEKDHGTIRVEWGKKPEERCAIDYTLPARAEGKRSGYEMLDLECRALPDRGVDGKKLAGRP